MIFLIDEVFMKLPGDGELHIDNHLTEKECIWQFKYPAFGKLKLQHPI
jgi:hypothetical protein